MKRLGKRENKNYRSVPTQCLIENSKKKKAKKFRKSKKKIPLLPHFKPKQVGRRWEREKIKIIVPFRFCPMYNRKFQKKKKQKNSEN